MLIGTKQIKNGAVTSAKIRDGAVASIDLRNGGVTGTDVLNGTLGLADLSTAARTNLRDVRAFGRVESNVSGGGQSAIDTARSRGLTAIERINTGQYCLTLDPALGIDLTSTAVLVGVDVNGSYESEPHADWSSTGCTGGRLRVHTFAGSSPANDVAFTVLIP